MLPAAAAAAYTPRALARSGAPGTERACRVAPKPYAEVSTQPTATDATAAFVTMSGRSCCHAKRTRSSASRPVASGGGGHVLSFAIGACGAPCLPSVAATVETCEHATQTSPQARRGAMERGEILRSMTVMKRMV
eukprot:5299024-Prymnesium_polylepis.2